MPESNFIKAIINIGLVPDSDVIRYSVLATALIFILKEGGVNPENEGLDLILKFFKEIKPNIADKEIINAIEAYRRGESPMLITEKDNNPA